MAPTPEAALPGFALLLVAAVHLTAAAASALWLRGHAASARLLQGPPERYGAIGGLRGLLAVSVLASHAFIAQRYFVTGEWAHASVALIRFCGTGCVALFFMITGLLFWGKALDGPVRWRSLAASRLRRIMPLYLAAMAAIWLLAFGRSGWALQQPLPELALAFARWLTGGLLGQPEINGMTPVLINCGVTWSLQYEWLFYLALPLLAPLAARTGHFLALALGYAALAWLARRLQLDAVWVMMVVALPFFGGMLAAYAVRRPHWQAAMRSRLAGVFIVLSVAVGASLYGPGRETLVALALTPAFILMAGGNTVGGLLRQPWLRWLGEISYGVYLLHGLVLMQVLFAFNAWRPVATLALPVYVLLCMGVTAAVVALASLAHWGIERRWMHAPAAAA